MKQTLKTGASGRFFSRSLSTISDKLLLCLECEQMMKK